MLSLRSRLFIVISLAVLIVLAISVALLLRSKKKDTPEVSNTTPTGQVNTPGGSNGTTGGTTNQPGGTVPAPVVKQLTTVEVEQNGVTQLAKIFIERYNTYSTDNNYDNIREVESMVTAALWKRISGRLTTTSTGPFVGVTTRAISAELGGWTGASADVMVQTAQVSQKDGAAAQTTYQGVTIFFIKQGDNWLVDKFEWQK
ncbi:MAG TPA: hypothetical protein VJA27_00275 [Patescibacteria group bacterium]|nr:hypothetical protein [Patescibacteria group bacterium]